jgi:ATP-dependent Clp protease ATP-binding subunit ClpA
MYERFTDRARKVMQLANQEAQRYNHEYIGTEHILLGLVKEDFGLAANVLKNLGIDLNKVRRLVEKLSQTGVDIFNIGQMPPTPRAKKVIEYALDEARGMRHNYVGSEHLLLGLLRDEECLAGSVLRNLGVKLQDVREEIMCLLGFPPDWKPPKQMAIHRDPYADLPDLPENVLLAVKDLDVQIDHLQQEKEAAVAALDFEKAADLRDQQDKLKKNRERLIREARENMQ